MSKTENLSQTQLLAVIRSHYDSNNVVLREKNKTRKIENLSQSQLLTKIRGHFELSGVIPPSYDNSVKAPPPYPGTVPFNQPTGHVANPPIIIQNQAETREEKPHLFDVGASKSKSQFVKF